MKRFAWPCLALALCGSVLIAPGCGSSTKVESTTVGQELQDLEEARNQGLITEAEYNKQRQAILDRD
jgi:hypothetical protein